MKDLLKSLLIIVATSAAFLMGLYIGEEKVKAKIDDFQEDLEEEIQEQRLQENAINTEI